MKIYNCLLAYVQDDIGNISEMPKFSVPKSLIVEYMRTRNDKAIQGWLKELSLSSVEFNSLGKGGPSWGFYTFIQEPEFKGSYITFGIAETLRKLIADKKMFAKINLLVERRFRKTKYAIILYELGLDYRDNKDRETGKRVTPWSTIDDLRAYLGASNAAKEFKIFNRDILKPALAEIQAETDIIMTPEFERYKKTVVKLRFVIDDNTVNMSAYDRIKRLQATLPVATGTKEVELAELMQILQRVYEVEPVSTVRKIAGMYLGRRPEFDQVCDSIDSKKLSGQIKTLGAFSRKVFEGEGMKLAMPSVLPEAPATTAAGTPAIEDLTTL